MLKVVHCKKEPYDIYIGRGSKWGNPFVLGKHGNREEVISKYRAYIMNRPDLIQQLPELQGKTLGCWCKPKACHGDVLKSMVEDKIKDLKEEKLYKIKKLAKKALIKVRQTDIMLTPVLEQLVKDIRMLKEL